MNVPGKIMIMMSKDKSQVFILRMSSTFRDININVQEDQGKEESDESDATDLEAGGEGKAEVPAVRESDISSD